MDIPEPDADAEATDDTVDADDLVAIADATDPADPSWLGCQWDASDALHERYLSGRDPADLDAAIRRWHSAVDADPTPSAGALFLLAIMVSDRLDLAPSVVDREDCVSLLERAIAAEDADPSDGVQAAACHSTLTDVLLSDSLGAPSVEDLQRAVHHGRLAAAGPGDPEERARCVYSLTAALIALHQATGDLEHLRQAIVEQRAVLSIIGADHPDAPGVAADLLPLLVRWTQLTDDESTLGEAEDIATGLLADTAIDHPDRPFVLTNSAKVLAECAHRRNDIGLLTAALGLYRDGARLAEPGTASRALDLINIATTCHEAYDRLGEEEYLTEGIQAGKRALRILGKRGPNRAAALMATANLLRDRFLLRGRRKDLTRAVRMTQKAVRLAPVGDPSRASYLTSLGVMRSDLYDEFADRAQLDLAISHHREALEASEAIRQRVPERQHDLSTALLARYKDAGNDDDLAEAVDWAERAVTATEPHWATWPVHANNLGNLLMERYELFGERDDLERAISAYEQVVAAPRQTPWEVSSYATNLGLALESRGVTDGRVEDVTEALTHLERSVALLPAGHPDRAPRISNHADALRRRSVMHHELGNLPEAHRDCLGAVARCTEAIEAAGNSEARLLPTLDNLAEALRWRNVLAPGAVDPAEILAVQQRAAALTMIPAADRFRQAVRWAEDAERYAVPDDALRAYALAVGLTTEVAWIGLSVPERLELLQQMNSTLQHALTFAVSVGQPWTAVAWADHVRSVVWRQDLAVSSLGRHLDDPGLLTLSNSLSTPSDGADVDKRLRREQARLAAHDQGESLNSPVPSPTDYAAMSFEGVVILLIPGEDASRALLLREGIEPTVVTLPLASQDQMDAQAASLLKAIEGFGDDTADPLRERTSAHGVFDCLDWLWEAVAAPVLAALGDTGGERPHLWWSPVGSFALLPIHAAGRHPRTSPHVKARPTWAVALQDRALSSYVSSVLPLSPEGRSTEERDGHLLYVSVDSPKAPLVHLEPELAAARQSLPNIPITALTDTDATLAALHSAVPRCRFLHIAGHGVRSDEDLLRAGFSVADGLFTLGDLAAAHSDDGELAVLLTCGSARGARGLPNESLHTAAAAHNAGFPDVVATTMPVRDTSAVAVAKSLYTALNAEPDEIARTIPHALDEAVCALRVDPATGPDPLSWAPYAHYAAKPTWPAPWSPSPGPEPS